jgi:N-acetylglucosamine malate deacetylase 2
MEKILLIYAHPDDESFGCGGTIAKYSQRGVEVVLVCATKGEAGKCGNPPICTPETIAETREQELLAATEVLGIKNVIFLGYLDAKLKEVDHKEAVTKLVEVIRREKPDVVITFGPDGVSGHMDHIVINSWATDAFYGAADESQYQGLNIPAFQAGKLYYNNAPEKILAMFRKSEFNHGRPTTTRINVEEFIKIKLDAIHCHRTQNMSIGRLTSIPMDQQKAFLAEECYYRVYPPIPDGEVVVETELLP